MKPRYTFITPRRLPAETYARRIAELEKAIDPKAALVRANFHRAYPGRELPTSFPPYPKPLIDTRKTPKQ